jgi:hypothetical protein
MTFSVNSAAPNPQDYWGTTAISMISLSQTLIKNAEDFSETLDEVAAGLTAPVVGMPQFNLPLPPQPVEATPPTLIDVTWTIPTTPTPFSQSLVVSFNETFTTPPPTLNFGAPPAPLAAQTPASPSVDLNFTYPDVADLELPSVPTLLTLDTVVFNAPVIPTFDVTVPQLTLRAPNIIPFIEGATFTSQLLTQVQSDLQNALSEGTWTGLPPDIETNLFDRAREREYRTQADAIEALGRMETLGWSLPPGVYVDSYLKIQTETSYTMAGLSRDIMVKQAELTLTNINEARKVAVQLETELIQQANNVSQRAFESAKYITEAAINLYNGEVAAYAAQLRGYEVEATVYDTQIKGILAQVQVLQAHIEYEKTKADINTALVNQYKTEVDAQIAVVEIYKLQVEIVQTQANVQKIIVDIFNSQIQAFVGEVNAYTAQIEAYKAQAETQGVIENVYKTQADVFKVQVDASVAEANAQIEAYKGQVSAYLGQIEAYKAQVQSMVGQAQAAAEYNEAQAKVYEALNQALASYNGTLTAEWTAIVNEQIQAAQVAVSAAKANGDLYIAARGLGIDAAKVGAQVNAQLGAAALGAIHWTSSAAWSYGDNYSVQNSVSQITETITSTSESA